MIKTRLEQFMTQWPTEQARLKNELSTNKAFNAELKAGKIAGKQYPQDKQSTKLATSPAYDALINTLPDEMRALSTHLTSYLVKGSIGQGGPAEVPWICIFDPEITSGAQHGFYPVYLFNANMDGVYLSLNQGWTQYENNFGTSNGRIEIRNNAEQVAQSLSNLHGFDRTPINLDSSVTLARGYELGNICSKFYPAGNIPDDDVLMSDLESVLTLYKELKLIVGTDILQIEDVSPKQSEEQFQNAINKAKPRSLPSGPIEKPSKSESTTSSGSWKRDSNIAATALFNKGYKCEVDPSHITFTGIKSHTFMEAHHLIPMEYQGDFSVSIDVAENILCLCPTCHRAFHNSEVSFRKRLVTQFFDRIENNLKDKGINVTKEQLLKFYVK